MSLTDKQYAYINQEAYITGQSKALIIRELIQGAIESTIRETSKNVKIDLAKPGTKSITKKSPVVKNPRTDQETLGGGPSFNPQPKLGKKKK